MSGPGGRTARSLAFALALLWSSAASAEGLQEYRGRLARWAAGLELARLQAEAGDPAWRGTVRAVIGEASQRRQVARPAGASVAVDHGWLCERLEQALQARQAGPRAAALARAKEGLAAYRAALQPARPVDKRRLDAILRAALPSRRTPDLSLLARLRSVMERLLEWLAHLLGRLPMGSGAPARTAFWLVLGLGVAVLAAALVLAGRAIWRRFERGPRWSGPEVQARPPWGRPEAEAELARARQAAAEGRYRDAIRHLVLGLVLRLDAAGACSYHPARTNWEYVRAIAEKTTSAQEPFRQLSGIFDRTWYGGENVGRADWERCETLFTHVLAGVGVT